MVDAGHVPNAGKESSAGAGTRRVAVWWIFPCKATSGIFRELAELGFEVDVFFVESLSDERVKLGWTCPDYGRARVAYLPSSDGERERFLAQFPYRDYELHLVNCFYGNRTIKRVVRAVRREAIPFGVLTEAPFNGFFGLRRWLKYVYLLYAVPVMARAIAPHAAFVCCLSGSAKRSFDWLERFGFRSGSIYPFGYFSEEPTVARHLPAAVGMPPLLVCTGYLTRNKGHLVLLKALRRLRDRGGSFRCVITGYGPERLTLEAYLKEVGLTDKVSLVGVVSAVDLDRLQAEADVFVAPGYEEPWAIRINEALQSGCPVVLSDRIGAAELIRASGGGVVFPAGNDKALAERLYEVLTMPDMLTTLKTRVLAYRGRIHPREAARFLADIIRAAFGGKSVSGLPVWLRQ